jgi:hypothetical protein
MPGVACQHLVLVRDHRSALGLDPLQVGGQVHAVRARVQARAQVDDQAHAAGEEVRAGLPG